MSCRGIAPVVAGFSALRLAWPRTSQLDFVPVCCSSVCGACSLVACALCHVLISTVVQEACRPGGGCTPSPPGLDVLWRPMCRLWEASGQPSSAAACWAAAAWYPGPRGFRYLSLEAARNRYHYAASGSLVTRMWPLPLTSALCWRQHLAAYNAAAAARGASGCPLPSRHGRAWPAGRPAQQRQLSGVGPPAAGYGGGRRGQGL